MSGQAPDHYTPDLHAAETFLTRLDEEASEFTFQVFPDRDQSSVRPEIRTGTLEECAQWLERANRRGGGVFVTVNETDGTGRKKENITRIRSIWQEADNGDEPTLPLEPHIVVESSPGKHHRYVLTDNAPLDDFEAVQLRMVTDYGSDPDAKDRSRVLRLPGFYHQKDPQRPHRVRVIHDSSTQPYDWQTVKEYFPPVDMTKRSEAPAPGGADFPELERMLAFIPNDDCHYADWIRVGMALHHATAGDESGYGLWLDWSADSSKHDDGEMRKKWESFGRLDSVVTIGSLIWMARQNGYTPSTVSRLANDLANRITDQICEELELDPDDDADAVAELKINPEAIDRMLNQSFWSGSKGKLFILNDDNAVNQYLEKDAWRFLSRACGAACNREAIAKRALEVQGELTKAEAQKEVNRIADIPKRSIMDEIKWRNQRDHVQWRVDMFATKPSMILKEDAVRIVLPHVAFPDRGDPDQQIIDDYKEHFPELDQVIEMIVASRFAGDRKKAFLWLLASSDWGKGFFVGCLNEMDLVVQMSVKEIEKVFEGSPAGKRPEQFKRAWVLAINEFKSVKAEIKQLESHMEISPKNQLTSEVELFAKLFMSAENVASMVTDHGVEDQFAQRFSLMHKRGSIEHRILFSLDAGHYRRSVVAYITRRINALAAEYIAMGRDQADRTATGELQRFHHLHGLANFATRFTESMGEIAEEFRHYLNHGRGEMTSNRYINKGTGSEYLLNATKELEDFLKETKPQDQVATIKRRKDDIFHALSVDGRGYASHRDGAGQVKAVKIGQRDPV